MSNSYLTHQRPPLTRGLSPKVTGGEKTTPQSACSADSSPCQGSLGRCKRQYNMLEFSKVVESMNKYGFQFLATREEINSFVESLCANAEVSIAIGNCESPNELSILQTGLTSDQICKCSFIYIKLGASFDKSNSMFICMGQDNEKCISESSIGIKGEGIEFDYWKKQISKYKRTLSKGAYVVNPYCNGKTFYGNVYYTKGTKEAFDRGIQLKPIAGWNYYLLSDE